MARPDKVTAVAEIAEKFRGASASVVTEYRGLTMSQLTTLRRSLGDGASYRVAKNTLVKRAAEDAGVEGLEQLLVGPTAITFITGEPVDAAKALRDFAKANQGLVIKGGYMDGRALTVTEVNQLADLEPRRRRWPAWPRHWSTSVPRRVAGLLPPLTPPTPLTSPRLRPPRLRPPPRADPHPLRSAPP
jgi:ribosomal protein L10